MKLIIATLLMVVSTIAGARCTDVVVGNATWHAQEGFYDNDTGKFREYNNANYLVGCITQDDYIIAGFENSYYDPAVMVAKAWRWHGDYVTPYIAVGGVIGYDDYINPHIGPLAPYGFVGVDLHPLSNKWGVMVSTVGVITSIGLRISIE